MKISLHSARRRVGDAFTRWDFIGIIAALGLLVVVAVPALSQPFSRSSRLVCLNNLRQIGQAFHLWGNDHDDDYPFFVAPGQGGIMGMSEARNVYYQFSVLSNELRTPRILACPSDPLVLMATDFSGGLDGGFLSPDHQNNSVSYFVSHGRPSLGQQLLSGDRHVSTSGPLLCPYFGTTIGLSPQLSRWSQEMHGGSGNVLMSNGDAAETADAGLRSAMASPTASVPHVVSPR